MDASTSTHPPQTQLQTQLQTDNKIKNEINPLINKIQIVADIKIEKLDIILIANVSICNQPMKFLIDSGAHASMIKSTRLNSNVLYYPQIRYCMVGINGPSSAIQTHGATFGNISINMIKLKQQFQIAGDDIHLNYDGILGMDFLLNYRAIIDMENIKITILLPINHNMYEFNERQMFDKLNPKIQKKIINNKLLYLSGTENTYTAKTANIVSKKIAQMDIQIKRFETFELKDNIDGNKIEILPNSEKKFTVHTQIPMLAMQKTFESGLYVDNTIVSGDKNTITVYNASCNTISASQLSVQTEPISNYSIYKINNFNAVTDTLFDTCVQNNSERINKIMNNLNFDHCNDQEKSIAQRLIHKYHDIFHLDGDGLTFAKDGEHRIFTKPGINPVNSKQYRIPFNQKKTVQEKINEMMKSGIIEPSTSLWNSPILLVPKKSSTDKKEYRFCVDYRNVNKNTETRAFPMPNLEEELCKMNGSKFFSTLDIASAFHQIKMHPSDKEKTAFSTGHQKYQFTRMPFGLSGSPITWQSYITALLGDLLNKNVMAYMDDILVYSPTINNHTETIIKIFECLKNGGLKLNMSKTKLFCKKIEYLGHSIDKNGVKPTDRNIEAIKMVPTPKKVAEVQRFVGMASYFRKFIRQFAAIAQPLHNLCKKNVEFTWSESCEKSFTTLKNALMSAPVLAFADFSKKIYISVDASFYAVGAYISNDAPPNDRPIEYFSKTLNDAQKNYATTHKELLAIILAIERFQHFIWGKKFVLYTDHQALTYLFSQNKVGSRLLRWKLTLAEYDFEIIHRKGSNNIVSDCLSRIEPTASVNMCQFIGNTAIKAILQAVTRSRTKESQIIAAENEQNKKSEIEPKLRHIAEEPSVTFDKKRFEKIIFVLDGPTGMPFKKLQIFIKRKIDLSTSKSYEIYALDSQIDLIFIPKINFSCEHLAETIKKIRISCQNNAIERIAINCSFTIFRTYWQFKRMVREIFNKTETSISLFTGSQVGITDVNDINEILRIYHRSILGGHRGVERMINTIRKFYYWPTMTNDIKKYVKNCEICEKTKIHKHTSTPLQITSVASAPFEKIYIDFVGEINPNSEEGHKYIMSISCDLTKYVIMLPTFDSTALTAARIIVEEVCLTFNFPKIIVSDNGPAFTADIFKQMSKLLDIKHVKTTPYHPQSNGGIERYHRTLGQYIRAYTQKNQTKWHKYLPFFTFSHNTTVHSTTGFAPHTLVFGFELQIPIKTKTSRQNYDYDSYHYELLNQLREAQERAKEMIQRRKLENKKFYDKKTAHANLSLKRNDLVLIINDVRKHKFDNKYSGPFRVEEVISPAVTKIKRKNKSVIVHNDKIKKSLADHGSNTPPLLSD